MIPTLLVRHANANQHRQRVLQILTSALLLLSMVQAAPEVDKRGMMSRLVGKRITSSLVAQLGKRPKELYSFGIGKRSISPQEMEAFMEERQQQQQQQQQEHHGADHNADANEVQEPRPFPVEDDEDTHPDALVKRDPYSFGLGKRASGYAFGMGKRENPYAFGLGRKRDPYAFGLGKRDPYAFGLGKRDPYAFGLGKRDPYAFGLGKRDPYAFGLGKRDPYAFGLGKRDPYAFGLGRKRDPYAFGLGKRDPYSFGLGKRSAE